MWASTVLWRTADFSIRLQLILPESFKLFPVYALAFIKTKALKGGPVVSDVRTHYMRLIKSMGVSDTMDALYPKMMAIHNVAPEAMTPDEYGRVRLPRLMRCSYARMEPHGAYFIRTSPPVPLESRFWLTIACLPADNGEIAVLWLGSAVSPQILRDLYDVESLDELNPRMVNCDFKCNSAAQRTDFHTSRLPYSCADAFAKASDPPI